MHIRLDRLNLKKSFIIKQHLQADTHGHVVEKDWRYAPMGWVAYEHRGSIVTPTEDLLSLRNMEYLGKGASMIISIRFR